MSRTLNSGTRLGTGESINIISGDTSGSPKPQTDYSLDANDMSTSDYTGTQAQLLYICGWLSRQHERQNKQRGKEL